jgi:NADH-quinone oxidoreductase subunit C
MHLEDFAAHLQEKLVAYSARCHVTLGELILEAPRAYIVDVLTFLRDDPACRFRQLVDLCGVDYPQRAERFDVVYHLLSLHHNRRIRVKVSVDADHLVPSVVRVFSDAGWFEREAWDLYGIRFSGNPDLRRILTDYGFEGHPLRKDFPLTGYVEVRYDTERKQVVYEPVSLMQDFRNFDFLSPWEGMLNHAPPELPAAKGQPVLNDKTGTP